MMLALILMCEAIVYKISYIQMVSSINLFTIKNTDHLTLGITIAPETFQALNSFWIFVLSPILTVYYVHSNNTKFNLSIYSKFSIGLVVISLSFILLYTSKFTTDNSIISLYWLFASYALDIRRTSDISKGYRCLLDLLQLKLMALWYEYGGFLAFALILGGLVAQITAVSKEQVSSETLVSSLDNYTQFFLVIVISIIVVAFFL